MWRGGTVSQCNVTSIVYVREVVGCLENGKWVDGNLFFVDNTNLPFLMLLLTAMVKAHNPLAPMSCDLHNVVILLARWCVYRRRMASDDNNLSFVLVDWAMIFVGPGGGACGTEQSEAIVPSPRRALRTVGCLGSGGGWDGTGEDQRALPCCPRCCR